MDTLEKFQSFINEEKDCFPEICDMMLHSRVDDGRKFLCAMNNLVDHFLSTPPKDDINFQIIYVPTCPEWARELLIRFLIHKFAYTTSARLLDLAKNKLSATIVLPEGVSSRHKQFKQIHAERDYFKKFINLFDGKIPNNNSDVKSLFVVQEKDVITRKQDKNPWLDQLFSTDFINGEGHVLLTSSQSAFNLENLIKKNRNIIPRVENLFIFHSQNRGRTTYSFNKDQLQRLNQYGLGIKNCFVFYISESPFRLYHIIEKKISLLSHFLLREIKRFDDFDGFITFSPNELDSLFNRHDFCSKYLIDSADREIFTEDMNSFFEELSHNYKIKNTLSLAFTDETKKAFLEECKQEIDVHELPKSVIDFINYYTLLWNDKIEKALHSYLNNCNSIAFLLPPGIEEVYKTTLLQKFTTENNKVFIVDYYQLKEGINADIVVLFTFRYTNQRYKTFPNSFDPLPLKNEQRGLVIINRLTHNQYYEWNRYFYDKDFNGLLFSDFRKLFFGWNKKVLQSPVSPNITDSIDEAEFDAREYMAEKCTIVFEGSKTKRLSADRVLYNDGQHYCICSLKELPFEEGMGIQILDDLVEQIKIFLNNKSNLSIESEGYIRRDSTFGLTQEQIDSDVELWKYILKRKVETDGIEEAYNAIFPVNKEISLRGFEKWLDFDYPMIFPRSRKSQTSLLKYLGFNIGCPYHHIILRKKLLKNSNTRLLNNQIESFLQSILPMSDINDEYFDDLVEKHFDILSLLDIKSNDDIKALLDLLDIKLKPIKRIIYDSGKA